jgi:hypothetical protein
MLQWRRYSRGMKILAFLGVIGWSISMLAMFAIAGVETSALRQPTVPDTTFRRPHQIKNSIRYFTDRQERIWSIAYPTML